MYCKNCGAVITDEQASTCPNCGAERKPAHALAANYVTSTGNQKKQVPCVPASSIEKWKLFAWLGCLIVCVITVFLPTYKASSTVIRYERSTTIFKGAPFFVVLSILLALAAIGLVFFTVLRHRDLRRALFLPAKVLGFLNLLLFCLLFVVGTLEAKKTDDMARFGLTVGGFLFVLSHIGVLALSSAITQAIKNNSRK